MAKTSTQQELVRLLVIEHGQKRAAELSGEPYEKVRKWTQRGNWLASQNVPKHPISTVVERVTDELADNERKTKLSLSRYAARAAQDSERATLRDSGLVKQVAQTAAIVHRWDAKQESGNTVVNIALLGVDPTTVQASVIDAEEVGSE